MSFAADTKNEMCKSVPQRSCCSKAECYGLLLFGRSFSRASVCMVTENAAVAHRVAQLAAQVAGVIVDLRSSISRRKENRNTFSVTVEGDDQRNLLLHTFGHEAGEINLRIHRKNIVCPECLASFLRGAFLCCGTVTDPNKEYHLEFVVPYSNLAKDLLVALQMCGVERLQPGLTNRKGSFVVYSKGMEQVTDLLTYLGAPAAAMELMQVKMLKEVRNQINRRTNFETANLDKTASAAARQEEGWGAVARRGRRRHRGPAITRLHGVVGSIRPGTHGPIEGEQEARPRRVVAERAHRVSHDGSITPVTQASFSVGSCAVYSTAIAPSP